MACGVCVSPKLYIDLYNKIWQSNDVSQWETNHHDADTTIPQARHTPIDRTFIAVPNAVRTAERGKYSTCYDFLKAIPYSKTPHGKVFNTTFQRPNRQVTQKR